MNTNKLVKTIAAHLNLVLFLCFLTQAQLQSWSQAVAASQTSERSAEQSAALAEASRLSNKVVQLYLQGKLNEAVPLAERALSLRQKVLSADDPLLADAFSNLGALYLNNDFDKAESLYKRALEIYDKGGGSSENVARVLESLTLLRLVRGDSNTAEIYGRRALALKEKIYGMESAQIAQTLSNLIKVYEARANADKAQPLYLRLILILEEVSASVPERISKVLLAYDCSLLSKKQTSESIALENRIEALLTRPVRGNNQSAAVESGVLNSKAICLPPPIYPENWGRGRVAGRVAVRVIIDETGKVIDAKAVSGPPDLMNVSEAAALRARFTPTKLAGDPVKVTGLIHYNFVIR